MYAEPGKGAIHGAKDLRHGDVYLRLGLIYLDPPFNSNRDYSAPIGSKAAGAAFKDTWTLDDVDVAWHGEIAEQNPAVYAVIDAAGIAHGKGMKSYLIMMAVRLLEMRRLLKPTGSLYLHGDPTAGAYLRMLLDAVFGTGNFRNEIVWKRTSAHGDARRKLASIHDIILFYAASKATTTNPVYTKHDPSYVTKFYRHTDARGRYRLHEIIRTASMGDRPNLAYEYKGYTPQWGWRMVREKVETIDRDGRIEWGKSGRPYLKRYLHEQRGTPITDMILDVQPLSAQAAERIGYPTQKPLALLDRIIKASSNAGDVVLDPFAGCATACVSAETLGRQWVGIDLSELAATLVNPNRKIFEARKRETAALGAGEKLVLGHPLAATIGDSARCMQNLEKVLFTGPKTSDTVTFICD